MNEPLSYPTGLLTVIHQAPEAKYHFRREGLEPVLQYLDEQAEYPKSARELAEFIDAKNYPAVLWVVTGTRKQCLDHAAADRITLELHAYCYRVDPLTVNEIPVPIHLYTRNRLKPDAGLRAKDALVAIEVAKLSAKT